MQGRKALTRVSKSHAAAPANLLRWEDVRLFLALIRAGSHQAAAALLGIDAATSSRRLQALEAQLAVHLFDRSRDGLAPTAYCDSLVPYAEAMEAAASGFQRGAESFERQAEGIVRITAPPGLANTFLIPALAEFAQLYPAITLEIDSSARVVDLTRREADIALRTVQPVHAELRMQLIYQGRACVAGCVDYVKRLGKIADWSETTFVRLGPDLAELPHAKWVARFARGSGVSVYVSGFPTQLAAVKAGLGLCVVPLPYLEVHALKQVSVRPALAADLTGLPVDALWLVSHPALRTVPRVAAVWEFLRQRLARFTA
jgi:DNA-binding transcriptional LysR family regulator